MKEEQKFKEAKTSVNIVPCRDHVIIKTLLDVSILEVATKKLDKNATFKSITLAAYGNMSLFTNDKMDIGTEVHLASPPSGENKISIKDNERSFFALNEHYRQLAELDKDAYIEATTKNTILEVVEYFRVSAYDIIGYELESVSDNDSTK